MRRCEQVAAAGAPFHLVWLKFVVHLFGRRDLTSDESCGRKCVARIHDTVVVNAVLIYMAE